ncbi:MAG: hypothetical protein ACLUG9_07695 [Paraclostridium sordellii]
MESGYGYLVFSILGRWLLMFTAFGFSFAKNKNIATLCFLTFSIMSAFWCYQMAVISVWCIKPYLIAFIQIICFIMIICSCVFWFMKRKKVARYIGIISVLVTIFNISQI